MTPNATVLQQPDASSMRGRGAFGRVSRRVEHRPRLIAVWTPKTVAVPRKQRYNLAMTRSLERAFAEASQLATSEQDRIAHWLMAEICSEKAWDQKFADSQNELAKLADEALADVARGNVTNLDSSKL